jgi:NTE family protein
MLDYDAVCAGTWPKLFVCATNVRTGKSKVFAGDEITPDAVLASACLPTLYQAVEIPDPETGVVEAYWDGGYVGNPALYPLVYGTDTTDVIIVHINPLHRNELPRSSTEILNRINEISFNSSLLSELRVIEFVHRLIRRGTIPAGAMKDLRVHSVQDDALMLQLGVATKLTLNRSLLLQLKAAGRAAMDRFLADHGDDIGHRSSVDLRAMFN